MRYKMYDLHYPYFLPDFVQKKCRPRYISETAFKNLKFLLKETKIR